MKGNNYSIYIGDDLIGFAKDVGDDMPWTRGRFEPTPLFDKYRELFELENRLADAKKWSEREKHLDAIYSLGLRLESPTRGVFTPCLGTKIVRGGFALFHIRGDQVSWRPT
jgi:hypothetical protein